MKLQVSNVTKEYGNLCALDGVTFEVRGGMFGLLGPNGAGKTTLMRIATGKMAPTSGEVRADEIDVVRHPDRLWPTLGYLPQHFGFFKGLTAYETLDYIAILKNIDHKQRKMAVESVLGQVNLTSAARQRVGGFSGGMKQRLGIAQALLGNPSLLIVDEPTAGLDPEERTRFRNLLARLSRDRTVILSTHIVGDIEATATALAVIRKGRVAFAGAPEELRQAAEGSVWELEVTPAELEALEERCYIISSRASGGNMFVRALSAENPLNRGVAALPTLEDGYMATVRIEGSTRHA